MSTVPLETTEIALGFLREFTPADELGKRLPKYEQLFDAFTAAIRAGRFKPGERVPAETELVKQLPVSLGTVQKALSKLARRGLITRHRKTGTYIAERRSQVNEVFAYRFHDPVTGKVMLPFVRALNVSEDRSEGPWSTALRSRNLVRLDRLVWVDQDPPAYSSVYLPRKLGKVFLDMPMESLHGSSTHRTLIDHHNLPTIRTDHRITCNVLDERACGYLMLESSSIGIVWDIYDYSVNDQPFLFQRFQLPPGHRPLELSEHSDR